MPRGKHHGPLRGEEHGPLRGEQSTATGDPAPGSPLLPPAGTGTGRPRPLVGMVGLIVVGAMILAGVLALTTRHHGRAAGAPARDSAAGASTSAVTLPPASSDSSARARFIPSPGTKLQVPVAAPKPVVAPSVPVSLDVPSLKIRSSLEPLGLLADGTMKPPTKWGVAGWYAGGTHPGAVGPAVIAGHIDSLDGPGIFLDLGQIKLGASIVVTTRTGQKFRFTVIDVKQYPKKDFPVSVVYGPTPVATLRLITCTGKFNQASHHYLDNLVVTSVLA